MSMFNKVTKTFQWGQHTVTMETGEIARQSSGAVLLDISVVDCGACVGVLPFVDDDTILMVRQYRYIAGRVTWEMPTGGVHPGETPVEAARRELAEEGGVGAGELEPLCVYHTSKSCMDETAHLFVARGVRPLASPSGGDATEFIRAEPVRFGDVVEMVRSGEIVDSMTIIAVLRAAAER